MQPWKKIALGIGGAAVVCGLVGLILYLRTLNQPETVLTPTASPSPSPKLRSLGNERFGPHARPETASNVDVGVVTVRVPDAAASPGASPATAGHNRIIAQLTQASPYAVPSVKPSTLPSATPNPTPTPLQAPPKFDPLPPPPAAQIKELAVFYAKGPNQKRQIYMRSIDRETDEQLVSDVYDDFGVSFSGAQQKVAFYSNEEGPSDATKARSTLKVVDLATRKVQTLVKDLPGSWPAVWSPDGKKLAIPTTGGIFLADVTTGTSLQIPTAKFPGAIVWAPGSLKFYFQAETAPGNNDIFQADGITAQASPVTTVADNETLPSLSVDGQQLMFLKQGKDQPTGPVIVVKSVSTGTEKPDTATAPAASYLFDLTLKNVIFVQGDRTPRVSQIQDGKAEAVGNLTGPTMISWDRDYQHVFVLADDQDGKALYSLDIKTGFAEKIKAGISETVPNPGR
jgi:hypothetical protein